MILLCAVCAKGTSFGADIALRGLSPIYQLSSSNGVKNLAGRGEIGKPWPPAQNPAFYAVCTNQWPFGLIPIFAVEKTNRLELRRRWARGQENFSEPLFFALPPGDEPDALRISGRWDCRATRDGASKAYLTWELAIEGEKVSGRFDQNTEYRFAFIPGGNFRSSLFDLRVEYNNEAYILTGRWAARKLKGEWHRTNDSEGGS